MKLHYFNIYGRAEAIRMLLNHAKVPHTDQFISQEDWPRIKKTDLCEFNQIPVLEIDGKNFSQSKAILRYLGVQHGYYPKDAYSGYLVDSVMDSVDDLAPHFFRARSEKDLEKQKDIYNNIYTNIYPSWCAAIEKRIQSNVTQKFMVGDKLTIADFSFAGRYFGMVQNPLSPIQSDLQKIFNQNAGLQMYAKNLEETFKEYLENRPKRSH